MRVGFFFFLFCFTAGARELKICLTGATEKIVKSYGEAFENGAKLAIAKRPAGDVSANLVVHYYDPTPLAPRLAIEELHKMKCSVVIGFSTMNDLLAIGDYAKEQKLPVISIYGEKPKKMSEHANVVTMQPSAEFLVKRFSEVFVPIMKRNAKRALVLTSIDQQGLDDYKSEYIKILKQHAIPYDTIDVLERGFDESLLASQIAAKVDDYQLVFLLARSAVSAQMTDKIRELRKPGTPLPIFVGTKNFGSAQFPGYLQSLKNKEVSAYYPHNGCVCDPDPRFQQFVKDYNSTYSKDPGVISAAVYDAINFAYAVAGKVKTKSPLPVSPAEFLEAVAKTRYDGITGVVFEPGLKLRYTKSFTIRVDKSGYTPIFSKNAAE